MATHTEKHMIPIIHLTHFHRGAIIDHLLSLSPEARRLRFGMALADDSIIKYVDHFDYEKDGLYGVFDDDLKLVAFNHSARVGDMVEFGVSVDPAYRGRGIGTAMFQKTELFARNHFLSKLYLHCLRENEPMMRMARRAHMKIIFDAGEVDSYLELPPADTASITADLAQEEFATFDLALKRGVHNFENAAQNFQSLFSAYMKAFTPKPIRPFAPKSSNESNTEKTTATTE